MGARILGSAILLVFLAAGGFAVLVLVAAVHDAGVWVIERVVRDAVRPECLVGDGGAR